MQKGDDRHTIRSVSELLSPLDDAVTFTVAAVARRLGVAAATLRTWDRRYNLGPSSHEAGSHRRYTIEDLARLETMRRMVYAGVPAAQASQIALRADTSSLPSVQVETIEPSVIADVIPLGSASSASRGLARAALSLDQLACREIMSRNLEQRGVIWTWDNVIAPVLVAIGERWATTERGVEVEHMLSEATITALNTVSAKLHTAKNSRPVLLAAAPDDLHSLPLYAVAAGLSEKNIGVRSLGARVPHDALVNSIQKLGPSAVLVWAQTSYIAESARLAGLPFQKPGLKVFAGGPGWDANLPEGVTRVTSITHAISLLTKAALA